MPTVLVTGPTVKQNLPFSSLAVAVITDSTHFANPGRDDQAELAWVACLNTETVYPRTVTHLSTNRVRRRVTCLMCHRVQRLNRHLLFITCIIIRDNQHIRKLQCTIQCSNRTIASI